MSLTVSLLFAASSALMPQNISLPPQEQKPGTQAVVQRPLEEVERFRRDLAGVRGAPAVVERNLQQIASDYPNVEALVIERLRPALPRELVDLMVVARRFGTPKIADELLFQLLARPLAEATRDVVETMVVLKGADAKKALQECIRGRIAAARRSATDAYLRLANESDLEFALQLAGDPSLDQQLSGVQVLAAVPVEAARQRLCELLSREPSIAGAACQSLVQIGVPAVPQLQKIVAAPPIDRAMPYAAFALAQIDGGPEAMPPAAAATALASYLRANDTLARSLAAVALAEMSYRGISVPVKDADIVTALIDIAEPQAFIANLELVRRPAETKLRQLTGRVAGRETLPWREWWKAGGASFAGMRANIVVDEKSVGSAQVLLRDDVRAIRLLGEELADLPVRADMLDYILTREQMQSLVAELQRRGFLTAAAATPTGTGLPLVRQLQLQIQGARAQAAAAAVPTPAFDVLADLVIQTADRELWQQLRNPVDEPDRGAFWRAECKWLAANPDAKEQARRFLRRVIKSWSLMGVQQRGLALSRILGAPDRKDLIGEEDGSALLEVVRKATKFGDQEQILLELAASSPGDRVWREAVDVAVKLGVGNKPVERVFGVLGADRVLVALGDARTDVRRAAIDEIVRSRDMRAEATILKLFDDAEPSVRIAAVSAAGALGLASARVPLIDRIVADDTPAPVRREALRALGKVGGEGVFGVLQRAFGAPVAEDREAAMRGLGELRDPRAAGLLADIFASGPGTNTGLLARFYLQRMGHKLAVPALRSQLANNNPAVRSQVVLLLGSYQDPTVIPDLVALLRQDKDTLAAATLLSCTIGLDVAGLEDRVVAMDRWYRAHREESQWQWLIQACKVVDFKTSLEPAQFAPGAGMQPVPELARILVSGDPGRLRVLAAAVLRSITDEDLGPVEIGTPQEILDGMAARYRVMYEAWRTAQNR